jgi:hypothetical protein
MAGEAGHVPAAARQERSRPASASRHRNPEQDKARFAVTLALGRPIPPGDRPARRRRPRTELTGPPQRGLSLSGGMPKIPIIFLKKFRTGDEPMPELPRPICKAGRKRKKSLSQPKMKARFKSHIPQEFLRFQ